MSSRLPLRRALRTALGLLMLTAGLAARPAAASMPGPDLSGGLSNGIPAEAVGPADLEFPEQAGQPLGGNPGGGYLMASSDGKVYRFGGTAPVGEQRDFRLTKPIVDIGGTPSGEGYWLVAADGGIFTFGDAAYYGSLGNLRLNKPIVGMAATPTGRGYWLVAADGGIFTFGDAAFHGSTGDIELNQKITGMATTPSGQGYWLVAADGGIFTFGDASFLGSTGDIRLAEPIVGMAATVTGRGYWLGAADGGVFTFGDADFQGAMTAGTLDGRIVGLMPQGGDVRAPVLRHLSFGPARIDTSDGPVTLKFRANITDDLSGHGVDPELRHDGRGQTQLVFANPAGDLIHLGLNVFFRDEDRIAGDRRDGIYRSYATVPANSPPGTWRLTSITMSDGVGNTVTLDGAVLAQAGFPTTFEQVGAGDSEPAEVLGITVSPDRIDTSPGPVDVKVAARVVDRGTGVGSVSAGFSNRNSNVGQFLTLVSGDRHDGIWEGTVTVPRHAHQGWWAAGVQVLDGARNINGFGPNFPSAGFTQLGPGDEAPPRIVSVGVSPPVIDTSKGPAAVDVTVHVTDDLSGVGPSGLYGPHRVLFRSPSQQVVEGPLRFVSGTPLDGVFVATITVPRYSEQGTWTLSGNIAIGDNALNWNSDQSHRPTFEVIRTETNR